VSFEQRPEIAGEKASAEGLKTSAEKRYPASASGEIPGAFFRSPNTCRGVCSSLFNSYPPRDFPTGGASARKGAECATFARG
jgi:hypothetical protein